MSGDLPTDPQDLARYAVGRPWWRWMPGMANPHGDMVCDTTPGGAVQWVCDGWVSDMLEPESEEFPDLADPATLGCLLAIAEGLAGGPVWLNPTARGTWLACVSDDDFDAPTRAAALIALCDALEGAK